MKDFENTTAKPETPVDEGKPIVQPPKNEVQASIRHIEIYRRRSMKPPSRSDKLRSFMP